MGRVRHKMVDRVFRGVGRIHRSLETADKKAAGTRERMLLTLYDNGKLDILKAIQSGRLSISQVALAAKRERLDHLPTAEALVPLKPAVEHWLATGHGSRGPIADATIKDYRQLWLQALNAEVFGPTPTVADVTAEKVEGFRRELLSEGHAPQANRFWSAARSFIGATLGKRHPQLHEIQDLNKYPEVRGIRPVLTPAAFWSWHDACEETIRPALVCMALTGMMPSELERLSEDDFDRERNWIRVPGQKTEGRVRVVGVPVWAWANIQDATPWLMDRSRFQKLAVKGAIAAGVPNARLYDCRHAFCQWHEDIDTLISRIKAYMGHGIRNMTDLYFQREILRNAAKDAKKLGAYVRKARRLPDQRAG